METRARGDEQVVQGGVGRACDAPPNATSSVLPPPAGHRARFTHPALRALVYPPHPPPSAHRPPFSLPLPSLPVHARSLGVAAALSNSRCNIQRLLAVVCGGGSGHRHQKKSPTWPEPSTVKLAPLSINRCASGIALSPSLPSFAPVSHPLSLPPANFPVPPPSPSAPSLPLPTDPYVFIMSFLLPLPRSRIGHRSADAIFAAVEDGCFSAVLPISAIDID